MPAPLHASTASSHSSAAASAYRPLPQGYTHAASDRYVQASRPALDLRFYATSGACYIPDHSHPGGYVQLPGLGHHDSSPDDSPRLESDEEDAEAAEEYADLNGRLAPEESTLMGLRYREAQQEVLRHGFNEVYNSEDYLARLSANYYLYWNDERYKQKERDPEPIPFWHQPPKHRTVAACIFLCLRIGFDPPGIVKVDPSSRLEAWTNPWELPRERALEIIGKKLQEQYEGLAPAQSRVKFKTQGDVHIEDFKKLTLLLRKNAKNDRALLHYNGHGVPKPTQSGEIWVFNKAYTQYIPVSLLDLLSWMGAPSVFVWDCHNAGNIVAKVEEYALRKDEEQDAAEAHRQGQAGQGQGPSNGGQNRSGPSSTAGDEKADCQTDWGASSRYSASAYTGVHHPPRFVDTIQLAACGADDMLPDDPSLPADLFTSCLTSPIETALRFYVLQLDPLKRQLTSTSVFWNNLEQLHQIPGRMEMRRTALGELTWIFTSVTDAIAWNCLPRELFAKIFRGDLVLAALFRGFLLAERVMRAYGCTPQSVPALPETHTSPLWNAWDLAVDMCLSQLPGIWEYETKKRLFDLRQVPREQPPPRPVGYKHSTFFAEQLTAFEVWLDEAARFAPDPEEGFANGFKLRDGGEGVNDEGLEGKIKKEPFPPAPPQLPIVLQVLLSQAHRLRALILLCRFMDMGPWAVHLSLSIGIFQYVLRLLQAPAAELKPVLIYIWCRILTVYPEGRYDLFRQNVTRQNTPGEASIEYFVKILRPDADLPVANVPDHKAMCAFILSMAARNQSDDHVRQLAASVLPACVAHLDSTASLQRKWNVLLLAHLWDTSDEIKGFAVANDLSQKLCTMLLDRVPEVRAAALYALGTLIGTSAAPADADERSPTKSLSGADPEATRCHQARLISAEMGAALGCVHASTDGSPLVRKELVITLSAVVAEHQGYFVVAAYEAARADQARRAGKGGKGKAAGPRLPQLAKPEKYVADGVDAGSDPTILAIHVATIYTTLIGLTLDPYPEVAQQACVVVDYIHSQLLQTPLAPYCMPSVERAVSTYPDITSRVMGSTHVPSAADPVRAPPHDHRAGGGASGAATPATPSTTGLGRGRSLVNVVRSLAHSASQTTLTVLAPQPVPNANGYRTAGPSLSSSPAAEDLASRTGNWLAGSVTSSSPPSLRKRDLAHVPAPEKEKDDVDDEIAGLPPPDEIIERIRQSDAERRRRRRRDSTASSAAQTPSSTAPPSPTEAFFDDIMSPLPLRSDFFDASARYFAEPQMTDPGQEEPGSRNYVRALWRKQRNEKVIIETQPLKEEAANCRWDSQVVSWPNSSPATRVIMHQFEDHLIASDDQGMVSVYDWRRNRCLNRFPSNSTTGTKVTTLKLVNEDDVALLLTGSSDGTVRLFRNYHLRDEVEIVTAFRGLPSIEPSTRAEAGLIAEWLQGRGQLLIGGNTRDIRIWDATRETCTHQIVTRANSCITSLTSDQVAGFIIAAGFGDGSVRIYDSRKPHRDAMIRAYRGHHSAWVQTIHMQRGGQRELLSGDLMGEVCQWDIRFDTPLNKVQTHAEGMPVMAVHEHAPVFATGSADNSIKVWPIGGDHCISTFRNTQAPSGGSLHRTSPIPMTALAFHPHRMMLAGGSADGHLSVFQCDIKRPALVHF